MKRSRVTLFFVILLLTVSACSAGSDSSSEKADSNYGANSYASEEYSEEQADYDTESALVDSEKEDNPTTTDRMIIHRANLSVKVKSLDETQQRIEKKVQQYGGYVVEATVYKENDEHISGYITVRIPEKYFQTFITNTETEAAEVLERNVSGQDITEEFVDLESRLKSKYIVEERLLAFMKEAKKTEDLLKISTDLATIQEEIEVITGRMKFLENQVAFSTVEISMYEKSVRIPELESKNLDTWEKTKKQLATSINFIISAGSGIFIFVIGSLPIIFILLLLVTITYFIYQKKRKE